ncbi:hypothetical protein F9K91_21140 [Brucella tritici]|uniref:Uncharacterized protein n=1 Tax=Brucella tritici TaxID=94626 RepID=A0A833FN04_9HYPH|nr:hypothetical protein [Brucella tritici]KAB2662743.1 hypothetical protein F9K91_21140 [Brucella tritici]
MASLEAPRRITELDAVNIILHNAGEETVITFGPNSKPSAQKAKEMLAEESIRLQSDGYNFCTSRNLRLSPNSSGEIFLPDNILSFQPTGPSAWMDIQEKSNRLYDASNDSLRFNSEVFVEAVLARPFADLPQPARWLIALNAAMRFANSENPGNAGLRVTAKDIEAAERSLKQYDRRLRKGGLRRHNPHFKRLRGNR